MEIGDGGDQQQLCNILYKDYIHWTDCNYLLTVVTWPVAQTISDVFAVVGSEVWSIDEVVVSGITAVRFKSVIAQVHHYITAVLRSVKHVQQIEYTSKDTMDFWVYAKSLLPHMIVRES